MLAGPRTMIKGEGDEYVLSVNKEKSLELDALCYRQLETAGSNFPFLDIFCPTAISLYSKRSLCILQSMNQ